MIDRPSRAMPRLLLGPLWLLCCAACGAAPSPEPNNTDSEPTAAADDDARERLDLPPLPASEVAGEDDDGDHIRDDVEEYIDEAYAGAALQRLSARQGARAVMHQLVYADDRYRALDAADELLAALECMEASGLPARTAMAELRARTTDTEARLRAYYAFQRQLGGAYLTLPSGGRDNCRFDMEGIEP